jgi:hypothetical protein
MEIPRHWRRSSAFSEFVNKKRGKREITQREMMCELIEGGKTRSADEVVVQFCHYTAQAENWGSYCVVGHPFLGSFEGNMDITEEIEVLAVKMLISE